MSNQKLEYIHFERRTFSSEEFRDFSDLLRHKEDMNSKEFEFVQVMASLIGPSQAEVLDAGIAFVNGKLEESGQNLTAMVCDSTMELASFPRLLRLFFHRMLMVSR